VTVEGLTVEATAQSLNVPQTEAVDLLRALAGEAGGEELRFALNQVLQCFELGRSCGLSLNWNQGGHLTKAKMELYRTPADFVVREQGNLKS